jgi:hypothetical protein
VAVVAAPSQPTAATPIAEASAPRVPPTGYAARHSRHASAPGVDAGAAARPEDVGGAGVFSVDQAGVLTAVIPAGTKVIRRIKSLSSTTDAAESETANAAAAGSAAAGRNERRSVGGTGPRARSAVRPAAAAAHTAVPVGVHVGGGAGRHALAAAAPGPDVSTLLHFVHAGAGSGRSKASYLQLLAAHGQQPHLPVHAGATVVQRQPYGAGSQVIAAGVPGRAVAGAAGGARAAQQAVAAAASAPAPAADAAPAGRVGGRGSGHSGVSSRSSFTANSALTTGSAALLADTMPVAAGAVGGAGGRAVSPGPRVPVPPLWVAADAAPSQHSGRPTLAVPPGQSVPAAPVGGGAAAPQPSGAGSRGAAGVAAAPAEEPSWTRHGPPTGEL